MGVRQEGKGREVECVKEEEDRKQIAAGKWKEISKLVWSEGSSKERKICVLNFSSVLVSL